jgi:TPR repeat protein
MFIHKDTDQKRKEETRKERHALELKDDSDDESVVQQDFDHAPSSDITDSDERDASAQRGTAHLEAAQSEFLAAAQAGDTASMVKLAQLFLLKDEPHNAVSWLEKASELGDPQGQYLLATCYILGRGVPVKRSKARRLHEAAAAQGHLPAAMELESRGQTCEARKHYRAAIQAAPTGAPQAHFRMAMYYTKRRKEQDAFRHFLMGAKAGDRECQYRAGLGYKRREDESRAEKWFLRAAAQGHVPSMYEIGALYADSKTKTYDDAKEWMQRATDRGHLNAMARLGIWHTCMWFLKPDEQDHAYGRQLVEKAAKLGNSLVRAPGPCICCLCHHLVHI